MRERPERPAFTGGRHLAVAADGVRFVNVQRAAGQPAVWIEAFRVAIATGRPVSEQVRACIRQHAGSFAAEDFVATEGDRFQLLQLLVPRPGLHARLVDMQACGLLAAIFPECDHLQPPTRRDAFQGRAGDSRLPAIRRLVELCEATDGLRARFASLLEEVRCPELLMLALLLAADDRSDPGRIARLQPALDRLQLRDDARRTVEFLIERFAEMGRIAFRGELSDSHVVSRFAETVGRDERLGMLAVVTAAAEGGGDNASSTAWKQAVLWRLYVESSMRLALGEHAFAEKQRSMLEIVFASRPGDITEPELRRFVGALPDAYFSAFGVASIFPHYRALRALVPDSAHASLERHGDLWRLTVAARRKASSLLAIVGVLSHAGFTIHQGQTILASDGAALYVFDLSDESDLLARDDGGRADLMLLVDRALKGEVDVAALVHGPGSADVDSPVDISDVEWTHAADRSIVAVTSRTDEGPALLYRIGRLIVGEGCEVPLVLTVPGSGSTTGVLHVAQSGQRLSPPWERLLASRLAAT